MRRAEFITAFILGIFSLGLMWKSGEGPSWDPDSVRFANIGMIDGEGPGSGFWPFWLALVMLICCIWTGYNAYRRTSAPSQSTEPFLDSYGTKVFLQISIGLFGFLASIHLVGFYAGMFLFMIYYIRFLGSHSWFSTLSISCGFTVTSFFFFDIAMRIVLPKGYLEPLFIPLYRILL